MRPEKIYGIRPELCAGKPVLFEQCRGRIRSWNGSGSIFS